MNEKATSVEIPISEYEKLIANKERLAMLWDYMVIEGYHDDKVIKIILGIKDAE